MCECCNHNAFQISLLSLKKSLITAFRTIQIHCCFTAALNVLLFFQNQPQHSTAGNLRALLCEVLSRYLAHAGASGGSMAANIHHTFCFTDSSLLDSFTQELRSQLSQVGAWGLPWGLQLGAVAVHTHQAVFGSCHTAPRGQELLISVPKCK